MSKFKIGQQVRVTVPGELLADFWKGDIGVIVDKGHDNDFEWLVESAVWSDQLWFEDTELEAV